ncbi:hypothetical protein PINS_up016445, partial [Pythium insidiosum]
MILLTWGGIAWQTDAGPTHTTISQRLLTLLRRNAVQRVLSAALLAPLVVPFVWYVPSLATSTVCSVVLSACAFESSWIAHRIHRRLLALADPEQPFFPLVPAQDLEDPNASKPSETDQQALVPMDPHHCAVSGLARRLGWSVRRTVAALLVPTSLTASGLFHLALLVVVDDRFHSTRLFRFRWIYAVITYTVAVAFALRTPDWPSATALLLLKMVFSLITVLSSMCPMNQLSCGPGARASDLCVIGLLALVLVHVARRKTALRTLVRLLLDLVGFLYLLGTMSVVVAFLDDGRQRLYRSALVLLLACVWAADTGAYVAGHALSAARYRSFHAIAPHVSPRKDYEGTAVAVACGVLSVSLVAAALQDTHDNNNNNNEIGTTTSVTMGGRAA